MNLKKVPTSKEDLNKYGFCVLKNIYNSEEIKKLSQIILNIKSKTGKDFVCGLGEHKEIWDFVTNDKVIKNVENLVGEKVYYTDGCVSNYSINSDNTDSIKISWHRDTDSAPRIFGEVPYCKINNSYNVFTVITYINSEDDNYVSVIPFSHKKKYVKTLSNLLRIFHWRTKNIKYLSFIRNFIEKKIAFKYKVEPGDCVMFYVSLFHKPINTKKGNRQAFFSRFGPLGRNIENYYNHVLRYATRNRYYDFPTNSCNTKQFIETLKEKEIYYSESVNKQLGQINH